MSAPKRLSPLAHELIERTPHLYVSTFSAWEIGQKHSRGRLQLPCEPREWFGSALREYTITDLPVTADIAFRSTELPWLHSDPADRITIATAGEHELPILTPDEQIRSYPGVVTFW
jgi:PIN domain nuclease of toxin-antitoxin system